AGGEGIEIRRAEPSDVPRLATLHAEAMQAGGIRGPPPPCPRPGVYHAGWRGGPRLVLRAGGGRWGARLTGEDFGRGAASGGTAGRWPSKLAGRASDGG